MNSSLRHYSTKIILFLNFVENSSQEETINKLTSKLQTETESRSQESVAVTLKLEELKESENNLKMEIDQLRDELNKYILFVFTIALHSVF